MELLIFLVIILPCSFLLISGFRLLFSRQAFGITHVFDKKRKAIIDNIIEFIKTDSDNWHDIDGVVKRYNGKNRFKVRDQCYCNESFISNERVDFRISFLECVRLSRHFKKVAKYKAKQKKLDEHVENLKAIDRILLETSGMDEL